MQISSWYTEHDKPLPGLFLTQDYFFPNKLLVSGARRGCYWDGALGLEEEIGNGFWQMGRNGQRERPNKKAEAVSECVSLGPVVWAFHWHKGLRQGQHAWLASPGA